ncbi:MAG: hypothetical protein WCT02_04810, partial [Candidatus Paceibacterota bacterium]
KIMTIKMKSKNGRFAKLAVLGEVVFHSGDAANIWDIKSGNTLHTTLSRYARQGLVYRLQKGLYSLKKAADLDPHLIGLKALHGPAYVSCETVLFSGSVVNQAPREITFVGGVSRRFTIAGIRFRCRKLHDRYLYNDAGIIVKNGIRRATLERAVADMLYFNPLKYFDSASSNLVDWNKVRQIAEAVGYEIKKSLA